MASIDHLLCYETKLRKFVAFRVPPDAVDDILQQVWLKLLRSKQTARTYNYLWVQARWCVASYYRREALLKSQPLDQLLDTAPSDPTEEWTEYIDLRYGLDQLPEREREALRLKSEGFTVREAGPMLGCSFVSASRLQRKGAERLR